VIAATVLLATLAACGQKASEKTPPDTAAVEPTLVCRIGPDGGPVTADPAVVERGIGGTGAPATKISDRGIGGTGISPGGISPDGPGTNGTGVYGSGINPVAANADGIGGTGIVGVITGFASVCVDGLEVLYAPGIPVDINGTPATAAQLRVGDVVRIQATGQDATPVAQSISVRTEVSGPIEAVELGTGALMIAGQRVVVPAGTWGANRFHIGDWTNVSGLRQGDGTLVASRLDSTQNDALMVRGQVSLDNGTARIGALALQGTAVSDLRAGQFVTVSGAYAHGSVRVASVAPDVLAADPAGQFGAGVNRVFVQAFVQVQRGAVRMNNGLTVPAAAKLPNGEAAGDSIVALRRGPDGRFAATSIRAAAFTPEPAAAPAPGGAVASPHTKRGIPASSGGDASQAIGAAPPADPPPAPASSPAAPAVTNDPVPPPASVPAAAAAPTEPAPANASPVSQATTGKPTAAGLPAVTTPSVITPSATTPAVTTPTTGTTKDSGTPMVQSVAPTGATVTSSSSASVAPLATISSPTVVSLISQTASKTTPKTTPKTTTTTTAAKTTTTKATTAAVTTSTASTTTRSGRQ
jgi:hypothetical protein